YYVCMEITYPTRCADTCQLLENQASVTKDLDAGEDASPKRDMNAPMRVNVAMWGKALRVIPRIDKSDWDALDPIARWLIATRSAVLVMTLISATIAGLLAARVGRFDAGLWAALTLGLVFAHATNNLVNDLTDS